MAGLGRSRRHGRVLTVSKSAAAEELSSAVPVMDPFHVVRLAGDALGDCRRRVQQATCGHRRRAGDPLCKVRRTLHTGEGLLTEKQQKRIGDLFANDKHVEIEVTWGAYQRMIPAYQEPERDDGKKLMVKLIESLSSGVPAALTELKKLGGTLKRGPRTCSPTSIGKEHRTARLTPSMEG